MSFDWKTQEFCTKLGEKKNISLNECKKACREESGCNAIIHDDKKSACDIGYCAIPLGSVRWTPGAIRGYFLKSDSFVSMFL